MKGHITLFLEQTNEPSEISLIRSVILFGNVTPLQSHFLYVYIVWTKK